MNVVRHESYLESDFPNSNVAYYACGGHRQSSLASATNRDSARNLFLVREIPTQRPTVGQVRCSLTDIGVAVASLCMRDFWRKVVIASLTPRYCVDQLDPLWAVTIFDRGIGPLRQTLQVQLRTGQWSLCHRKWSLFQIPIRRR